MWADAWEANHLARLTSRKAVNSAMSHRCAKIKGEYCDLQTFYFQFSDFSIIQMVFPCDNSKNCLQDQEAVNILYCIMEHTVKYYYQCRKEFEAFNTQINRLLKYWTARMYN